MVEAVEDLHQGGLAGPVLTQEAQDLTPVKNERDIVVSRDRAKAFGHAPHLENDRGPGDPGRSSPRTVVGQVETPLLRLVGDLDVALDDPLPGPVHLVLDLLGDYVVEAAERSEGDPPLLKAAVHGSALGLPAFSGALYGPVDGVVHPLDHGGKYWRFLE